MYLHFMPYFNDPLLTESGEQVCQRFGIFPPETDPMPNLVEPSNFPDAPDILGNVEKVEHPRIKTIESYLDAGWVNAQNGTWLRPEANALLCKIVDSLLSLIHI